MDGSDSKQPISPLKRLGGYFGKMPPLTRFMAVLVLVLAPVVITVNGEWGEVLEFLVMFAVMAVGMVVIGFVTLGLSKIVGEKAATWIVCLLILGALGGCVGYVLSNWGY